MRYTDVIGPLISPVTGRLLTYEQLPPLDKGEIWLGHIYNQKATPSLKLIDLRIDVNYLTKLVNNISLLPFLLESSSNLIPNAQVLDSIGTGVTKIDKGVFSIAELNVDYITLSYLNSQLSNYVLISGFSGLFATDFAATFPAAFNSAFALEFPAAFLAAYTPAIATSLATYTLTVLTPAINAKVSSVNITGSTGLSISGSPITSSGTITLTLSSGLQDLSSYSSASFLQVANNLSDILNSSTARANLGLTNVATQAVTNNSILIGGASNSIVSQALTNGQILIGSTGVAPVATVPTNGTNISWNTGAGSLTANISGQIALSNGGTGLSSTTAYGVLCGGTTSTGNLQNAGTGSSGYFLGGNGASTLPSWKTAVTSVAIASGSVGYGLSVSGSPITGNGTITVSLNNELMGVSQISSLGMIVRRTGSIYSTVQLTTSSAGLSFTNPDGVASNPQINLNAELQGVAVLSSIGLIARTTSGTYTARTITAGNSSITVNNGDGVTANPSITIGTVPIANLANYPYSSTQFLRGNGSWSQPTLNDIGSPTSGSTFNFNNGKITNLGATTTIDIFTANAPIISNSAFTSNGPTTINYGALNVTSTGSSIDWATWFAYFKMQTTGLINPTYSAVSGTYNLGGIPRSIICAGAVSATEFESTSSIKKKNIISNYEDFKEELKEKFDTIDFVKYEWKDKLKEGFGEYYGYIAENVSKAFPELVNLKHTEYAPNILEYADLSHISGKNYRITFNKNIEIEIGKKLKIISKNKKIKAILTMKEHNNSYLLSFLADTPNVGEILVYGSYEEVPLVSKTRFHDMSAARLKILIDEVSNLSQRIEKIEINIANKYC
jgi:hypothetical protein